MQLVTKGRYVWAWCKALVGAVVGGAIGGTIVSFMLLDGWRDVPRMSVLCAIGGIVGLGIGSMIRLRRFRQRAAANSPSTGD
jgi:hypothetical protein